MRYRPDLDLSLKDVSVMIRGGERIGICGRTGAGKSSLTLALFRIIEPASGKILIDGIDIGTIGLQQLRCVTSIIPQNPQLFEGTLRSNVDPTNSAADQDIWQVLSQVSLRDHVMNCMGGTLDAKIAEGAAVSFVLNTGRSSEFRSLSRPASARLLRSYFITQDQNSCSG